ncbi:MAG TPA: RNA polymerase sigma factor [Planctomycetota bacterium]|nr:RNA polymerase sigma factor [Planctomycetota bacterium]
MATPSNDNPNPPAGPAASPDGAMLSAYAQHVNEADRLFSALVERHGGMVYQTCLRIVGDPATAEDASQATFLVLAKKARQVRGDVGAFLHGVAVNVARRALDADRLRKLREREAAQHREARTASQAAGSDGLSAAEAAQAWAELEPYLDESIEKLPARQREAVVMHYLEGRTQEDVALRMGLSRGTVAKHVQLGLEKLRQRMAHRSGSIGSVALLTGRLGQFSSESGCPTFLAQHSQALAAAGYSSGAAGLAPQVVQMGQGAIQMMMWAKVKAVATVAAACIVMTLSIAAAVEMTPGDDQPKPPVVAPGEKPAEKPAPLPADAPGENPGFQKIQVGGLIFEPQVEEPVWLVPGKPHLAQVHPSFKVTNTTKADIYFNRLGFLFELLDAAGQTLATKRSVEVAHEGPEVVEITDYVVLKAGATQTIDWETATPASFPELGPLFVQQVLGPDDGPKQQTGETHIRFFPVAVGGPYKLQVKYAWKNANPEVFRQGTAGTFHIAAWTGEMKAAPIPLEIQRGYRFEMTRSAKPDPVTALTGSDGCLVIRSAERLRELEAEWATQKLDESLQWLGPVDFSKDVIVCGYRAGNSVDRFSLRSVVLNAKKTQVVLYSQFNPPVHTRPVWECIAVVVPKTEAVEFRCEILDNRKLENGSDLQTRLQTMQRLVDGAGGDVVDGLQGQLDVKNHTIQPGDDIVLTFELRDTYPKQSDSIYVWDNKYSNGYRNDAYLVTKPDGTTVLLRRPEQPGWDKNIPTAIEIKPKSPWTLGGVANDPIKKSLRGLGLDTTTPGTYTIVGLYMESGGDSGPRAMGGANAESVPIWGGNIATPAVTVTVAAAKQP